MYMSGAIWKYLETCGAMWKYLEAPRRHPGGTQEAPRRNQKAPRRPEGSLMRTVPKPSHSAHPNAHNYMMLMVL